MSDIGWGVLGTGAIASLFAEGLTGMAGARLAAVGSRSRESAQAFAARFGFARAHGTYRDLVADPAVDVVYVATPNELHEEHCRLAIDAGKAVLCEKPFALDAASGARVVAAARRAGVFCMEAMWMRFSPAVREALAFVRAGGIGEVRLIDAQLGFPYVPDPRSRLFAGPGAGALLDLGVYPLSLAHAFLGPPARARSEVAVGASGADEQVTAVLGYASGAQAVVGASLRAQLTNGATIHGTEGVLELEAPLYFPHRYRIARTPVHRGMRKGTGGALARLRSHRWARAALELRARMGQRVVVRRCPNGYGEEAAEVGRCLRAGLKESPELPLDGTLAVLETIDAVRASARER